jgi:sugar phosphate isomerase/epimerase
MAGAAGIVAGPRAAAFAADTPARRDGEWVIGCYTRPWAAYDYRVALDAIAEAGFKHAGLMTTKAKPPLVISVATTPDEAARVAEEVKKRGLKVPSVYGGGFPVNKSVAEGATALRRLIDSCAAVQAKTVLMGGIGDPKFYQTYYRAIAECCDYAAEKGMAITIKPHGGMNATGPQCRKAIELVGNKNFQLWYDPGNIYYYSDGKLDPVVDAATVDGLVTGMCVKDYEPPKNVMLTPGTGQVDFPAVMARLKKGGFSRGPMVVETLKPGSLPETLEQAKKARQFVEELTRKVDAMP